MERQSKVFEEAVRSVVKIMTGDGGVGTGFVARGDGLILTAAHVVGRARVVYAQDWMGRRFGCRLLGCRRGEDLAAVVGIPNSVPVKRKPLRFIDLSKAEPAVGEQAIAIGNPSSCSDFTFSSGYISAGVGGEWGGPPKLLQMNMSVNWGNSGGPVLLLDGRVCGMAVQINYATNGQRNEGVAHAVPALALKHFSDGVSYLGNGLGDWVYCSVCGKRSGDEEHCTHCGVELPPIEREEREVAKVFGCRACGAPAVPEATFCGTCGIENPTERTRA
jgi:S1-C subfamily serine protease